jgi:hypothetical protein
MQQKQDQMAEIIEKIELSAEIARVALACPTCRELVKGIIQNYHFKSKFHPEGGPSTDSSRLTEGIEYENRSRKII